MPKAKITDDGTWKCPTCEYYWAKEQTWCGYCGGTDTE